jgi:hypothetical protein
MTKILSRTSFRLSKYAIIGVDPSVAAPDTTHTWTLVVLGRSREVAASNDREAIEAAWRLMNVGE